MLPLKLDLHKIYSGGVNFAIKHNTEATDELESGLCDMKLLSDMISPASSDEWNVDMLMVDDSNDEVGSAIRVRNIRELIEKEEERQTLKSGDECSGLEQDLMDILNTKDLYNNTELDNELSSIVDDSVVMSMIKQERIDFETKINNMGLESKSIAAKNSMTCNVCDNRYVIISETRLLCKKCGEEKSVDTGRSGDTYYENSDYNTSSNSFMPFRFVGSGSRKYHKSLLGSSSDYSIYSKNINKKEMYQCNDQYIGKKVPKIALNMAVELFVQIKKYSDNIYRNHGKRGLMGACLYYSCIALGISKTTRDIAAIMCVEDKFQSQGDRIIREMNELGIVNIVTKLNPINDYVIQYFYSLHIDMKYKQFVIDLIDKAEAKKLHIFNDSRPSTKCAGSIYMLTMRVQGLNVSPDDIARECSISKTTFKRYYKLLYDNHIKLKNVFKKHKIPMCRKWRTDKSKEISIANMFAEPT